GGGGGAGRGVRVGVGGGGGGGAPFHLRVTQGVAVWAVRSLPAVLEGVAADPMDLQTLGEMEASEAGVAMVGYCPVMPGSEVALRATGWSRAEGCQDSGAAGLEREWQRGAVEAWAVEARFS
ncbi:MAG TPA: hypothetical protein PKE55_15335, partial [Kiritimatiellia bacterium]|nr:hypothetical protein [Kiritimatiellia bacterium]